MANSSSVQPWALTMPLGSLQQWTFTFTTVNQVTGQSQPYPISGATWEYSARLNATDYRGSADRADPGAEHAGRLVVTATAALSQVQTRHLPGSHAGSYTANVRHALWITRAPTTLSAGLQAAHRFRDIRSLRAGKAIATTARSIVQSHAE